MIETPNPHTTSTSNKLGDDIAYADLRVLHALFFFLRFQHFACQGRLWGWYVIGGPEIETRGVGDSRTNK